MDRVEVIVSPDFGDAQGDFNESKEKSETDSSPSIKAPKIPEPPARVIIKIPAGLYDLYW